MAATPGPITVLLAEVNAGAPGAHDRLYARVYEELRGMAEAEMARERRGHVLQPTALVNEAFLRLVKGPGGGAGVGGGVGRAGAGAGAEGAGPGVAGEAGGWQNRRHFFGAAARAMRHILVDESRQRRAQKRGGGVAARGLESAWGVAARGELGAAGATREVRGEIEAVDAAVTALEREDEALAEVVVLRFFGGLTNAQVAEVTNVSARTVNKRWSMAKVWLARWLEGKGGRGR